MTMSVYITAKGDTWDNIAYQVYGNEELIQPIMEANIQYIDTAVFNYGIELVIPEIDRTDDTMYKPPWRI